MPPEARRIDPDGVYNAREVAALLGLKLKTVQGYFQRRELKGRRTGNALGGWVTTGRRLIEFLEDGGGQGAKEAHPPR